MTERQEIRIITLEKGVHNDDVIRKFERGWKVRFMRGATLLGLDVNIRTSLTGDKVLSWSEGCDHLSVHCDLECSVAGAFRYEFFIGESKTADGSGYFLVMPELKLNGETLPLNGISCITHITKLLGNLSTWEQRLRVAAESGYNMVHLTPIHALGISNSAYSIADHHALNPTVHSSSKSYTFDDMAATVARIESELKMLTVQDVVWNHAAKNAKWLQEHPESSYNCLNSPHLRPAYVLDRLYHQFGREVSEGKWEHRGIPTVIDNVHHTNSIEYVLRSEVLPSIRLHEFFQIDISDSLLSEFKTRAAATPGGLPNCNSDSFALKLENYSRMGASVDWDDAMTMFNSDLKAEHPNGVDENERLRICSERFRDKCHQLNEKAGAEAWEVLMAGLQAVMGGIVYERLADNGPRKGRVDVENPLTTDYFLHLEPESTWDKEERLAFDEDKSRYLMAFNGWIMSSDPLKNFALKDSQVYLRRELVCWGDSVKLNYGDGPADCPFLWEYMKQYTQQCAEMFHGLRIDNAHGTPIHVAEYFLKAARDIRPNLYVFAELFTGSESCDNIFVNRLGLTSLIREAQSAGDSHEQGRLVYRYGGDCVGAMRHKHVQAAEEAVAHALFLDQSHDNPTPIETRSVLDLLPTAGMVSMCSSAVGSTRGYDELVRHAVNVVTETRSYGSWGMDVNEKSGIVKARKVLNDLHTKLAKEGYSQVFVDQMSTDVVGITRHKPQTHETVILIAHTVFNKHNINTARVFLKHFAVGGVLEEVLFEMKMVETGAVSEAESATTLLGLSNYEVEIREHLKIEDSNMAVLHGGSPEYAHIELTNLCSSAVIAFKVRPLNHQRESMTSIANIVDNGIEPVCEELTCALSKLSLLDLNRVMFCCASEDRDNIGVEPYDIPNWGSFKYNGIQGFVPVLDSIRTNNDLGHPLCQNLRDGTWLCEYTVRRLNLYGCNELADCFEKVLGLLEHIAYYLRPMYFEALIGYLYRRCRARVMEALNPSLSGSSAFVRALALSSLSFSGYVKGAGLAPLPESELKPDNERFKPSSLAAGLPHFATGIWRNWGRDTFIALPGCLLVTNRFEDARRAILSFGGTMRHGLIPNLLAEGIGSRYNCRDAVWFWLYAITRYVSESPEGHSILKANVLRCYADDDAEFMAISKIKQIYDANSKDLSAMGMIGTRKMEQPLWEVMFETIERHFQGISFRERNAGTTIDEHMKSEGFNVDAFVDKETGFICGGNQANCGTWMDKMGSSGKAGNAGEPATPRDGAAVELQGLALAVLESFSKWNESGHIAQTGVSHESTTWTWNEWASRLREHFAAQFFVDDNCQDKYVNKRGIVKDTVGSTFGYTDFQLRPNFSIALSVAPSILDAEKAWVALDAAKEHLLGPLGIKTLDPGDWAYNGNYNNDDDGNDKKTAKGWNYHQGPEWVWVAAFYMRARLVIGERLGGNQRNQAIKEIQTHLGAYYKHIQNCWWRSLPELTNENGSMCFGSCPAQAWSVGCVLEVCQELQRITRAAASAQIAN